MSVIPHIVQASGVEPNSGNVEPYGNGARAKELAVVIDCMDTFSSILKSYENTSAFLDFYTPKYDIIPRMMDYAVSSGARSLIRRIGAVRDFSGVDTSSYDGVIVASNDKKIFEVFVGDVVRICRELGRIVLVTKLDINATGLGHKGVAGLKHYRDYGYYAATVRKIRATLPQPASAGKRRKRKPVKIQ